MKFNEISVVKKRVVYCHVRTRLHHDKMCQDKIYVWIQRKEALFLSSFELSFRILKKLKAAKTLEWFDGKLGKEKRHYLRHLKIENEAEKSTCAY